MKTKKLLVLALCLFCAGLAYGLPKNMKNKNNNVINSVSQEEDSDLIPIPDHLLEDYKHSGKIDCKILSLMNMVQFNVVHSIVYFLILWCKEVR